MITMVAFVCRVFFITPTKFDDSLNKLKNLNLKWIWFNSKMNILDVALSECIHVFYLQGSIQCFIWWMFFMVSISGSWTLLAFFLYLTQISNPKNISTNPHSVTMGPIITNGYTYVFVHTFWSDKLKWKERFNI